MNDTPDSAKRSSATSDLETQLKRFYRERNRIDYDKRIQEFEPIAFACLNIGIIHKIAKEYALGYILTKEEALMRMVVALTEGPHAQA